MAEVYLRRILALSTVYFLILFFFAGNIYSQDESKIPEEDNCINCHVELEILPADYSEYDVHLQKGLSCAGCHGGDPELEDMEESMDIKKGFKAIPSRQQIPNFCGKCHSKIEFMRDYKPGISTDQVKQYFTSEHGIKNKAGDQKTAECVSCHSAHSILPASDTRSTVYALNVPITCKKCHSNAVFMKGRNIPTNQFEIYSQSVHGEALLTDHDIGAPACNDCHGNHGAKPPGAISISHVCGSCHVNNFQFFEKTKMAAAFESLDFHGCDQCHGHHFIQRADIKFVGISEPSFCVKCHQVGEAGYESAKIMRENLDELQFYMDSANVRLTDVKIKGMNDIEITYALMDAKQKLIESRTLVHKFDTQLVTEKTGEGIELAKNALDLSNNEIDEYYSRRGGFLLATGVFVLFAVFLFIKIRGMKSTESEKNEN